MDRIAKTGWTFTMKCASIANSLFHRCLPVPEALKTGPISGEVRRKKVTQMTPIPAKVLTVEKQSSQYRVLVQIELEKYLGSFHTLRFGESKPFTRSCYHGQLDLFYYRDPGLRAGKSFPLWTIM
jgi:hypothetical protein